MRANYRNVKKGVSPNPDFLIRFFRNLLLGEQNDLRNRAMLIDAPAEWSTPSSSETLWANLGETTRRLVAALGGSTLSAKEAMAALGLKDRKNFREYTLGPALKYGIVCPLYPDKLNHPGQKYRLTIKGAALFNENKPTSA